MTAANDNATGCAVCTGAGNVNGALCGACYGNGHTERARERRNAARDIGALARSGHVEAGGALPISQRVQTSGRGDPQLPRWSAAAERAQRILGRGYAEGGEARRCALALWLVHGYSSRTEALAIGLGVLLESEAARHETVREWTRWGVGGSADTLAASAVELLGRAVAWYDEASDEAGRAGELARLVAHADGVRSHDGVVGRLIEWHRGWVAGREDCHAIPRRVRCDGARGQRTEVTTQRQCNTRPFSWSTGEARGARCESSGDDCGCEWGSTCEALASERRERAA